MNELLSKTNRPQSKLPTPVLSSPPMFDHEKLDVYQLELQFIAWVTDLLEEVSQLSKGKIGEVSVSYKARRSRTRRRTRTRRKQQ